mgnify:CR=1 FL=1
MTPSEERVLSVALRCLDGDPDSIAIFQDVVLEEEFDATWVMSGVPWRMPDGYNVPSSQMTETTKWQKRQFVTCSIAAFLLFLEWPNRWPLAADVARSGSQA